MSKQTELACWEIIQCNRKDTCLLAEDGNKTCWQAVKEDRACSFHICVDCLIYLVKQDDSHISDKEFCSILSERKTRGIRQENCSLAYQHL